MRTIYCLLFGMIFLSVQAQTSNENLNTQLDEMKTAILNEDYSVVVDYALPKVIEMYGGEEGMLNKIEKTMGAMKTQGLAAEELNFNNPSSFVEQKGYLQCTLDQILVMKSDSRKIQIETTLFAVSDDGGENWKFLDVAGMPVEFLRNLFPNLHPDITLKPKQQKVLE